MGESLGAALSDDITGIARQWWDVAEVAGGDPKQVVG